MAVKAYLRRHWRGQQSLVWSFWVNLVLVRALLLGMEGFILAPFSGGHYRGAIVVFAFYVLAHGVVYIWQVVGVVRACDRYQSAHGSISVVLAVHFGIIVSVIFTFANLAGAIQSLSVERDTELLSRQWERERAAKYALKLSDDGRLLYLDGSFELGITKKVKALLRQHSALEGIVLASPGGSIYEGRGIAITLREHDLDTYVYADCFSACTLAFVAGRTRFLGQNGKLGFHQYGLDADYQMPFVDIEEEQRSDRSFLAAQGVDENFLEKVFGAAHSNIWIPTARELLEAGVVHEIAPSHGIE